MKFVYVHSLYKYKLSSKFYFSGIVLRTAVPARVDCPDGYPARNSLVWPWGSCQRLPPAGVTARAGHLLQDTRPLPRQAEGRST